MTKSKRDEESATKSTDLEARLEAAEEVVRAISEGEVDAFLVRHGSKEHVLVLDGIDRPYHLLIEKMQQGAATLDADGRVLYSNSRFADLLGATQDAVVGSLLSSHVGADDQPAIAQVLAQGKSGDAECEVALLRSGSGSVPALLTVSSLVESNGTLCVIATDLTQRKHLEEERDRLVQEQLGRQAAEHTAAVMRDADRRKDEFLAVLAHELRNPLAPLRYGLQILELHRTGHAVARETVEMMERQVDTLIRLVDDLMDVARLVQGKIELQRTCTDLNSVVTRAVESSHLAFVEGGRRLETALSNAPLPVDIDVVRMTQVIVNLLNNAVKFTERGATVWLSAERSKNGTHAVVRVRDSGIGIASDMLDHVFDSFAQVPSATRGQGGLGIGLSLAKQLVSLHGGRIHAISDGLGRGAEFVVELPLSTANAERCEHDAAGSATAKPFVSRKVLVVDDNADSTRTMSTLIRALGHEACEAFDGSQAIRLANEYRPDLVLLDIALPDMNGYEVARAIRSESKDRHVQIVALTGFGSTEDRQRSRDAGCDGHLVKPVQPQALASLLATLRD